MDITKEIQELLGSEIIKESFIKTLIKREAQITKDSIEVTDGEVIVIHFTNGKIIEVWASEFGGISKPCKHENIKSGNLCLDCLEKI